MSSNLCLLQCWQFLKKDFQVYTQSNWKSKLALNGSCLPIVIKSGICIKNKSPISEQLINSQSNVSKRFSRLESKLYFLLWKCCYLNNGWKMCPLVGNDPNIYNITIVKRKILDSIRFKKKTVFTKFVQCLLFTIYCL